MTNKNVSLYIDSSHLIQQPPEIKDKFEIQGFSMEWGPMEWGQTTVNAKMGPKWGRATVNARQLEIYAKNSPVFRSQIDVDEKSGLRFRLSAKN